MPKTTPRPNAAAAAMNVKHHIFWDRRAKDDAGMRGTQSAPADDPSDRFANGDPGYLGTMNSGENEDGAPTRDDDGETSSSGPSGMTATPSSDDYLMQSFAGPPSDYYLAPSGGGGTNLFKKASASAPTSDARRANDALQSQIRSIAAAAKKLWGR